MRVLFLTKYPREGASSRYRVYQFLPYLREAGVGCDVQSFMSGPMYRRVFSSGRATSKILHYGAAVLRRLAAVSRARSYDLVFMQREALPFGPPLVERLLRRLGVPTVFDYDDALFVFKPSTSNPATDRLKHPDRLFTIFSMVDCVIAGNEYLGSQARRYARRVEVLPPAEDTDRVTLRQPHSNGRPIVIGWLGSQSTEKYLHLIEPALRSVCERAPGVRLRVVGGGRFGSASIPVEHVVWSETAEVSELHRFDIGIMPLPDDEWSKGKCGGKARTYMAAGVPPVCSAVGFNLELIEHGVTGFLVQTSNEWEDALLRLIHDPALRTRVGTAGRRFVERCQSVRVMAPRLEQILRETARGV